MTSERSDDEKILSSFNNIRVYLEAANVSKNSGKDANVDALDFVKLKKYLIGDKSSIVQ